ncbi:TetR/AcrR family transcriptional regulator [Streptomyces albofaciens JCM 4342]|uniref:TetR/AcrR family transcriptional regulator n=1 Tax=Streptomyces albofaciens TaxID=66866 RepID=UPI00123AE90B|nr:TetR/AcrR family transcriptional regulator [Streptomyces albofaciens]KAA6214944.1 TetR/AcrR family transcriptional regulator [Streptomyces albofaciens JCM 4342]
MPDIKHFDPDAALEAVVRLFWERGVAATGIQEVVDRTGVSRSSLYATFGGKQDLYLAALRRYVEQWSRPAFARLAADPRGLPAVTEFFTELIRLRCSGPYARWGCMIANAHTGPSSAEPAVRRLLDEHHESLVDAMRSVLSAAAARGQLAPGVDPEATAGLLALLAYGVNLRSRTGADPAALEATVKAALAPYAK